MANLDTYIRPNAIGVLMVQMDADDSGTLSTEEVVQYINTDFYGHINNIVPPTAITAAQVNFYDGNGNGEFDQGELLDLFHSLMMHLASINSPGNAMGAFTGYTMMITAFNNRFDEAPVAAPVVAPVPAPAPAPAPAPVPAPIPAPAPGFETCPICLDDFDNTRPVKKCLQCNAWFHTDCIATICNGPANRRLCPSCRANWPHNCAGLRTRNGPVMLNAVAGGNHYPVNKRNSHKRKSDKRKSNKRKSDTRKSHTRKSHTRNSTS